MVEEAKKSSETQVVETADIKAVLDAVKALTKEVSKLVEEWGKWRRAGKF